MSRICKLWAEVKREFWELGEFSLLYTPAQRPLGRELRGRAGLNITYNFLLLLVHWSTGTNHEICTDTLWPYN